MRQDMGFPVIVRRKQRNSYRKEEISMQVTVYNCRVFDEKALFMEYAKELGIELVLCADAPDLNNVSLCKGSRCVDVITSRLMRI